MNYVNSDLAELSRIGRLVSSASFKWLDRRGGRFYSET